MKKQTRSAVFLAQGAMIAAIYTVLTLLAATMNLAYGPVQFRFSEALTILPMFTPAAVPGLTIGCLLSNIFSGYGAADMIFGTLATLLAAISTDVANCPDKGYSLACSTAAGAVQRRNHRGGNRVFCPGRLPLDWICSFRPLGWPGRTGRLLCVGASTCDFLGTFGPQPLSLRRPFTPLQSLTFPQMLLIL